METKNIILKLRMQKGLSQDELAEKIMVTRQAVSRWENGETVPNTETLKLLSKEFDVSINTLLGEPRKLDRVVVRIWGARSYDDVLIVDQQGNLFIPEVGPVHVAGTKNSNLLNTVRSAISRVYTDNVQAYVSLQSAQPVAVYVTGFVNHPGRYAGGSLDSVLSFLDRAGGIDPERGSYRRIEILRNKKVIADLDLYQFALAGNVNTLRLKDGDVILVKEKGISVSAYGLLREEAVYELTQGNAAKDKQASKGARLIELSSPLKNVSHVSVSGTRNKAPFNRYFSLEEFKNFALADGDIVEFAGRKELVMVTNAEFPPYESKLDSGDIVGIDVDIMKAVCDKLGRRLEITDTAFDSVVANVERKMADVGVAAMTITDERKKSVDFTEPYMKATQVVIVRK